MITIITAMLVFGIIIAIHEFGHFAMAKLCKIKVNKFAIGMGPVILKKQGKETEYSLRLLPIGGFCAMEGEDSQSNDKNSFHNKPVWQRMLVVLAGAIMNLILGFILIMFTTLLYGDMITLEIADFPRDTETGASYSTSKTCGLQIGDKIISMDGMRILTDTDLSYKLQNTESDTMDLVVLRNGEKIKLNNVKFYNTHTQGRFDFKVQAQDLTIFNLVEYSFLDTISVGRLIWISLKDLVTGKYGFHDLSGPVGIIETIGEAANSGENFKQSLTSVLSLASFITVNVGIFNLLPIPALDGARFVFLLLEAIRRKPISPEREGMVHFIGMAVMFLLMIAVTFQDIFKLVN
ncbi:MAG: site-2 protease family protein [Oscillospiraceae bacterium]|nr:peptidase [Ruminococcus sp.]MDE6708853.1 site-2 protease family protein [Oscillospiraceae bacterium]